MTSTDTLLSRVDTRLIYPPFLTIWRMVLNDCAAQGVDMYATCGWRSPDEQMTDYLKGRQTPGVNPRPEKPLGDTVTRAKPYDSWHQYGIAGDATRDGDAARPGLQPTWSVAAYGVYAKAAAARGLRALGPIMGDWPHVELAIEHHGLTLSVLRVTMKSAPTPEEGLRRVWALLDRHGPWTATDRLVA